MTLLAADSLTNCSDLFNLRGFFIKYFPLVKKGNVEEGFALGQCSGVRGLGRSCSKTKRKTTSNSKAVPNIHKVSMRDTCLF